MDIIFEECQIPGYPARTKENIALSDVTISIARDFGTPGEKLTRNFCKSLSKPYFGFTYKKPYSFIILENRIQDNSVINFAGNGIYNLPDSQQVVDDFVYEFISRLFAVKLIKQVRSGGQTGIDEAAIKAARNLGIPSKVLSPKNWIFRGKDGVDIPNEFLFKNRFKIQQHEKPIC